MIEQDKRTNLCTVVNVAFNGGKSDLYKNIKHSLASLIFIRGNMAIARRNQEKINQDLTIRIKKNELERLT